MKLFETCTLEEPFERMKENLPGAIMCKRHGQKAINGRRTATAENPFGAGDGKRVFYLKE